MALKNDLTSCSCDNAELTVEQTLFLGCSVESFNANLGWNSSPSTLSVTVIEDDCAGTKKCWTPCMASSTWTEPDPGFFGMPRWERGAGNSKEGEYTSCTAEDASDTIIRPAIRLEGLPSYFRMGNFEYCGIISDWVKNISCDKISYTINIQSPKIVLDNTTVITGKYAGCVNGGSCVNPDATCSSPNVLNVYGFMEAVNGNYSPPYGLEDDGSIELCSYKPIATLISDGDLSIDGLAFGSPGFGFGGANLSSEGMPLSFVALGINLLANSIPAIDNCYSPYGRIVFHKPSWLSNGAYSDNTGLITRNYSLPDELDGWTGVDASFEWCGLMEPSEGTTACTDIVDYYYVDISELPTNTSLYRIGDVSLSISELIEQLSRDFGFDYYIELVPVLTGGSPCVTKFIKVRTVDRTSAPDMGQLCTFLDSAGCKDNVSQGRELRSESNSRFLIGANKQTIYQACQDSNPDANFTSPTNDADTIASLNAYLNTITTKVGNDNTIRQYYGKTKNGDGIVIDDNGSFQLPIQDASMEIQNLFFGLNIIFISRAEVEHALMGLDAWLDYVLTNGTETGQAIIAADLRRKNFRQQLKQLQDAAPRDRRAITARAALKVDQDDNDLNLLYNLIYLKATKYHGKAWLVRTPFTSCFPDAINNKIRRSDIPTNDGGWTEASSVLGLPNPGYTIGQTFNYLNFFRGDDGKIKPFVRFNDGAVLDTNQLDSGDYFFFYLPNVDFIAAATTGSGAPDPTTANSHDIYIDTDTSMVYFGFGTAPSGGWVKINDLETWISNEDPATGLTFNGSSSPDTQFLWVNSDTGDVFYIESVFFNEINHEITAITSQGKLQIYLYVRAQVQEEYLYDTKATCYMPMVLIEIPGGVGRMDRNYNLPWGNQNNAATQISSRIGAEDGSLATDLVRAEIDAAAIPIRHFNIQYGPWCNPSNESWNSEVIQDDQYAPWNFGSYVNMNTTAQFFVDSGQIDMWSGELGQFTIPGFPLLPLGAEIGALAGGFFGGAGSYTFLVENRSVSTTSSSYTDPSGNSVNYSYNFFNYGGPWTGIYGPSITNMAISMTNGCDIQTTYNLRTFAPRQTGLDRRVVNFIRRQNQVQQNLKQQIAQLTERLQVVEGFGLND